MNNSYFFIALLLCIALAITFFFPVPPALADEYCVERWDPECNDSDLFNGYWWRGEGWVPGLITRDTHFLQAPPFILGYATYYAKGMMEATAHYRGLDLTNYVDGVAMMSCADIGQIVWIRSYHPLDLFEGWDGPFLVVDCAELDDMFPVTVFRREVVEVGFETAQRWGLIEQWTSPVWVLKSRWKPPDDFDQLRYRATQYRQWFEETVSYYSSRRDKLPVNYVYDGFGNWSGRWYIEGRWKSFLAWEDNPRYIEPWIRDLIYRIGD